MLIIIPVIASKSHGGIYEILDFGKNGFLYDLKNKSQLEKLIFLFCKNKTIFQKKAFLAHKNLEKFSPKKTITKFEKLIDKTI